MKRLTLPVLTLVMLATLVALAASSSVMAVVEVGGWNVVAAPDAEDYMQPSADSGTIVWSDYRDDQGGVLKQYHVASGEIETVLVTDLHPTFPILDGDNIIFQGYSYSNERSDSAIYLFSLASKQLRRLSAEGWQGEGPKVSGDVVAWMERKTDDQGHPIVRLVLHRLATDQAITLVQTEPGDDHVSLSLVSERWVLWRQYPSQTERNVSGYSLTSGEGRTWEVLREATLQTLDGDVLYYTIKQGARWHLHTLDLATGADVSLFGHDQPIQSVCVDGGRIAWASTGPLGPFVAISDRIEGGTTVIRSPAYEVGGLSLKGDLLLWRADRLFDSPITPGGHVFVYDASDKTAVRVSSIQSYPHGFASDGETIAASESSYRPGRFATHFTIATKSALDETALFSDVSGTDPYWTAIEGMREMGAVAGYPRNDGRAEFRPAATLMRSQFAKMLVEALKIPLDGDYLTTLVRLGILQGGASGNLDPYGQLTRAQMITMTVRAADKLRPGLVTVFIPDKSSTLGLFDKTHGLTLRRAEWGGLLDGLVGFSRTWDPWRPASRAETAQVLWNLESAPTYVDNVDDSSSFHGGPGTPEYDGVLRPLMDASVDGWWMYLGHGRFVTESGRDFFWRDGRFVNFDGSLMEIPASVRDHLHNLGIDAQPTATVTYHDTPRLAKTLQEGVSITVTASQWTDRRVCATVLIRNDSGLPFVFQNRDLQLYVGGVGMKQTQPDLAPFEVAAGTGVMFRTDIYFVVPEFDPAAGAFLYTPAVTQ